MSSSNRIEGDSVFCHNCYNQWDRANGGLTCPRCESEHVEIIDNSNPPPVPPHPQSPQSPRSPGSPRLSHTPNPFQNHNPWAPDPEEDDITTFEFNTGGGGRGTFSFSSRTYTFGGGNVRTSQNIAADDVRRNFESMLGNIMGFNQRRPPPAMTGHFFEFPPSHTERGFPPPQPGHPPDPFGMLFPGLGQQRAPGHEPSLFDLIIPMLNPANARRGDTVFSQEAFDRVMTQLMEQNTSNAPGPASESAIAALRKKPVDKEMMGSDGKAECSICMDNLALGDEVTVLPCKHWFHGECVISWLKEHDTCPHCRQPITNASESNRPTSTHRRRRSSRRSSSVASPMSPIGEGHMRDIPISDSPSGLREARQRFYGTRRTSEFNDERPPQDRRSSDRNSRSTDNSSGGGVTGWLRNRLPFSG